MPVIVDYARCDHHNCFPLEVCPQSGKALLDDGEKIVAHPELCGDCAAPCLNFCDKKALRYAPDMEDLELVKAQLAGTMTAEQVADARAERKKAEKEAEEAAAAGPVKPIKTADWEKEVLQAELPVAVDFWAEWCGPCKQMAPVYDQLAQSYAGYLKFVKVNSDEEQALTMRYRIQGIPTLMFFWQGQEVDRVTGAVPASALQTFIYQLLAAIRAQQEQQGQGASTRSTLMP